MRGWRRLCRDGIVARRPWTRRRRDGRRLRPGDPPTLDSSDRTLTRQRGKRPVALIAAALVVVGAVGTVAVLSRETTAPSGPAPTTPSGPGMVEVHHSQYLASWDAQLDCATPLDDGSAVRSVVIDT